MTPPSAISAFWWGLQDGILVGISSGILIGFFLTWIWRRVNRG